MSIVDAQVHIWASGPPTNPAHRQVPGYSKDELVQDMDEAQVTNMATPGASASRAPNMAWVSVSRPGSSVVRLAFLRQPPLRGRRRVWGIKSPWQIASSTSR
jgi:hypothetical protein